MPWGEDADQYRAGENTNELLREGYYVSCKETSALEWCAASCFQNPISPKILCIDLLTIKVPDPV